MTDLSYWKVLTRRKTISDPNQHILPKTNKQKRMEISSVGIATSFGVGIFVIIGFVARNIAGPSVVVCIPIAALLAFVSATFYAELSCRISKNASTYTYIYVCIGEIQAFIVGWTIILEYIIGMAIVSDSIGLHVDTLLNDTIKNSFKEFAPINWSAMANYFDFVGFAIPIFFAIIVNIGLKRSVFLNKVFVIISIAIMLFIVIAGAFRANKWYEEPSDPLVHPGVDGFAPFEYFGVLKGIAVCIFIFIGFDVTGTGGRLKSYYGILCFGFVLISLVGVGTVVTLAHPFYLLNEYAQLPQIFNMPSWYTAYWIIAIGGIIVLFASLYELMFCMQITVLAMAKDSLLPKSFDSDIHTKPIIEILCAGLIAGLLAGLFQISHLIDTLSIGIMFGFMAMAFAVVMFRYSNEYEYGSVSTIDVADSTDLPDKEEKPTTFAQIVRQLFNNKKQKKPTNASYAVVKILLAGLGLVSLGLAWMANFAYLNIYNLEVWAITVTVVLLVVLIIIIFLISLQPMRKLNAIFMVPFVPLSPAISIFVNIYLMMSLHYYAWIRFGIWIILGLPIYLWCIRKYNRRSLNSTAKSSTLTKNGIKNHGFVGDIERHPSYSFNSQSQMTYKSDEIIDTENENVNQAKVDVLELQREIPISPKSTKKPKAPIPMSFKSDKKSEAETSTNEGSLARKSRTPSPNSSKTLDDIVLVSEVIDTLTEMREPNGKTYFVDETRTSAAAVPDTHEDSEQKTAIAYLDDVLKKEDVIEDSMKGKSDEIGYSTSVIAVVHLNGVTEDEQRNESSVSHNIHENSTKDEDGMAVTVEVEKVNSTNDEDAMAVTVEVEKVVTGVTDRKDEELIQKKLKDQDASPQPKLELENRIVVPELPVEELIGKNDKSEATDLSEPVNQVEDLRVASNKDITIIDHQKKIDEDNAAKSDTEKSISFKERLAMLLGQQTVAEPRKISPRGIDHIPRNKPEPTLKHSKSEPDIMQMVFKDIRSKYEHNEPDGLKPSLKPLKMTATDDIDIDNFNPNVPAPPKFDPFIYKTIGSRHNARRPLKIGDANIENEIPQRTPATAPIIMDNEVVLRKKSVEEDDQTRMVSLKDRLENILRRGPPDRFSRPKSIVPVAAVDAVENDIPTEKSINNDGGEKGEAEDQQVVHFKESKKPFDTVHKQKLLFDDVLKSIGAENTRPSIIRANSITKAREKPTTIESARKALKHISPDWKKNIN